MIHPNEIRRKAERLYPQFLIAWLNGEEFFPRTIPSQRQPNDDLSSAIQEVQRLRNEAKETVGHGYSVEWKEVNSRTHGRNLFPARILFETPHDFLKFISKKREFDSFTTAVEKIRTRLPALDPWIRSHRKLLSGIAADVPGLVEVVEYLQSHPRPGLFARELPLSVDTKFVERNQHILRDWLDLLLPPHMIRADETHFERRYGLRYAEPHLLMRLLDPSFRQKCGFPWPECSVPLQTLAEMQLAVDRVIIVENKVNLLTLPLLQGTLAFGGLGYAVTDLRLLNWLREATIWYWGDVDTDGYSILSTIRSIFPQTQSLMMDHETLQAWKKNLMRPGTGRTVERPSGLTESEEAAFQECQLENLRIEQEHLPQWYVQQVFEGRFSKSDLLGSQD